MIYGILSSTRGGLETSTTMVKYQSLFRGTAPPGVGLSLIKTDGSGLAELLDIPKYFVVSWSVCCRLIIEETSPLNPYPSAVQMLQIERNHKSDPPILKVLKQTHPNKQANMKP